jgi:NAD(P)-dependent dehydrogenase (short-subunit alcohol dehydrogenase family)
MLPRKYNTVLAGGFSDRLYAIGRILAQHQHDLLVFSKNNMEADFAKEIIFIKTNELAKQITVLASKYQRIDHLVIDFNGLIAPAVQVDLFSIGAAEWQQQVENPLLEMFTLVKWIAKQMSRFRSGRILLMFSALDPIFQNESFIQMSLNSAVRSFIVSAAKELARYGIVINGLEVGAIDITKSILSHEALWKIPLKRAGKTDELIAVIENLFSLQTGYVNGQIISVDGGLTC